jgi:hypothetical protein
VNASLEGNRSVQTGASTGDNVYRAGPTGQRNQHLPTQFRASSRATRSVPASDGALPAIRVVAVRPSAGTRRSGAPPVQAFVPSLAPQPGRRPRGRRTRSTRTSTARSSNPARGAVPTHRRSAGLGFRRAWIDSGRSTDHGGARDCSSQQLQPRHAVTQKRPQRRWMAQVRVTNRVTFDLGWRLRAEGSVPRSAVRSDVGVRALVEHGVIRLGISVTKLDHGSELATDAGGVSACDPYWPPCSSRRLLQGCSNGRRGWQ